MTDDKSVLEVVSGYKLPFTFVPNQLTPPSNLSFSESESKFIRLEIDRLLQIGAV